jgi:hypothetical protein
MLWKWKTSDEGEGKSVDFEEGKSSRRHLLYKHVILSV